MQVNGYLQRVRVGTKMVKKQISNFSVFLLSLIIIIINEPRLSIAVGGTGILVLMGFFLVLNFRRYVLQGKLNSYAILLVTLYLFLELAYEALGISKSNAINYYYTISFFFFSFAITPVLNNLTRKQQNILIAAIILSLLVAMVSNIQLSSQYGEYYIRLADYYSGYTNVINTQYVSSLVIFSGLVLIKARLSCQNKMVFFALLIFSIYFIITVGQRLTAIILLVALLLLQILYLGEKKIWRYFLYLIAIFAVIILIRNYESILLWISDVVDNTRISKRINQLIYALKFGEIQGSGGSLEARFDLMMNSINTFLSSVSSILFGIGEHRASDALIGHHSQWLDQAAKYGLLGCTLMFATLKKCFHDLQGVLNLKKDSILYTQYYIIIGYFVVRGIIGYVVYPYFGIMIFVLLPLIFIQIREENFLAAGG